MNDADRTALLDAARKILSEVGQRCGYPTLVEDDTPPDVDAFMAAVRLGDVALVYPLNGAAVNRQASRKSTWTGDAPGWVVITARTAWLCTDPELVDDIYDKHMELELSKIKRT